MIQLSRRAFAKRSAASTIGAMASMLPVRDLVVTDRRGQTSETLQSEFLLDLSLQVEPGQEVGSVGVGRLVVPVVGGTFSGPRLKGTVTTPGGDWIVPRPDGSRLLDVRVLFRTDDGERIFVSWRGIAYTTSSGALNARIVPMFETGAAKYAWLNNVVAVGVYRPGSGPISYRLYRIL